MSRVSCEIIPPIKQQPISLILPQCHPCCSRFLALLGAGLVIATMVFSCIFFLASALLLTVLSAAVAVTADITSGCGDYSYSTYKQTCANVDLSAGVGAVGGEWVWVNITAPNGTVIGGYNDYVMSQPDPATSLQWKCWHWQNCEQMQYQYVVSLASLALQGVMIICSGIMLDGFAKMRASFAGTRYSPWLMGPGAVSLAMQDSAADAESLYSSYGGSNNSSSGAAAAAVAAPALSSSSSSSSSSSEVAEVGIAVDHMTDVAKETMAVAASSDSSSVADTATQRAGEVV